MMVTYHQGVCRIRATAMVQLDPYYLATVHRVDDVGSLTDVKVGGGIGLACWCWHEGWSARSSTVLAGSCCFVGTSLSQLYADVHKLLPLWSAADLVT